MSDIVSFVGTIVGCVLGIFKGFIVLSSLGVGTVLVDNVSLLVDDNILISILYITVPVIHAIVIIMINDFNALFFTLILESINAYNITIIIPI